MLIPVYLVSASSTVHCSESKKKLGYLLFDLFQYKGTFILKISNEVPLFQTVTPFLYVLSLSFFFQVSSAPTVTIWKF